MTPTHQVGMAAAKAEHEAARAAFRAAQARLAKAKAKLQPFLDAEAANARAEHLRGVAAAVQAWLDGATEKEAAGVLGYKSAGAFDGVRYRLIEKYAPETRGTAYDECLVDGVWSHQKHREVERRHAAIALKRYHDANP